MKMAVQDKELQAAVDYSAGQKEAAYRVLGEIRSEEHTSELQSL